jgi:hypothetical protein
MAAFGTPFFGEVRILAEPGSTAHHHKRDHCYLLTTASDPDSDLQPARLTAAFIADKKIRNTLACNSAGQFRGLYEYEW